MTRLLTPPEIELWELARGARQGARNVGRLWPTDPEWWHSDFSMPTSRFLAGASPEIISALLETLEKTREALADHHEDNHDHCDYDRAFCRRIEALLAGFSGDAPSEVK